MARDFDGGGSQFLRVEVAVVTAAAFTVSLLFNLTALAANSAFFWMGDKDDNTSFWAMEALTNSTVRWRATSGGSGSAVTGNTVSTATWHHGFAIEASATSRTIMLDGDTGNAGTDTTSKAPNGGNDRTSLGRFDDAGPSNDLDGLIAEVAVWNVALTTGDGVVLSKGTSPLLMRPNNLVAYWPLTSPVATAALEPDLVGGNGMTVTGATVGAHPHFIPASSPSLFHVVAAAAANTRRYSLPVLGVG